MTSDTQTVPGTPAGDRGSMALATLVIVVGVSLSVLLLPIVVGQLTATRVDVQRSRALNAAQAGIDIAMAQLRAAADPSGKNGALEKLPSCDLRGDLSPGGAVPSLRYRVAVVYRNADAQPMSCPPVDTPTSASLTSTGAGLATGDVVPGAKGSRTLTATYLFSWFNANITGGAMRISKGAGAQLCMDAGTNAPTPPDGAKVMMLPCQSGSSRQRFAYTKDQNIRLVGSGSVSVPGGMCLDGGALTSGINVVFRACGNRIPKQRWVLDAVTDIYSTSNGISRSSPCLDLGSYTAVSAELVLGSCGSGQGRRFTIDIAVGAGMADATTGQLVNYRQFNRCVDVTNGDPNWSHMIAWYCHQAPDGNFAWNQRWAIPTPVPPAVSITGRIRTIKTPENAGYCLRSPGSVASNQYVDVEPCTTTSALGPGMLWTVYADTGSYTTAYRIVDEYGFCLTFTDLDVPNADRYNGVSKTKVATCSASTLQKWNADPNISRPTPLVDIDEN